MIVEDAEDDEEDEDEDGKLPCESQMPIVDIFLRSRRAINIPCPMSWRFASMGSLLRSRCDLFLPE